MCSVNYCNMLCAMCLLLVAAKESRLLSTGPAGPLLRARRAFLRIGEEPVQNQGRIVHHLLSPAVLWVSLELKEFEVD